MTLRKTLTALFDNKIEGLARFGCGAAGLPYYEADDESK